MGSSASKTKLPKEDLIFLMDNTNFTRKQIKAWYKGFMAIYNMVGPQLALNDPADTPERRTKEIFVKMDENRDGVLSKDEFVKGCLADQFLYQMLTADSGGGTY
jgi:Ca2+-binding EF-hand superfamily protein